MKPANSFPPSIIQNNGPENKASSPRETKLFGNRNTGGYPSKHFRSSRPREVYLTFELHEASRPDRTVPDLAKEACLIGRIKFVLLTTTSSALPRALSAQRSNSLSEAGYSI